MKDLLEGYFHGSHTGVGSKASVMTITDVYRPKEDDMTRAIGYVRVSTKPQGQNGYGLAAQRDVIESYCATNNLELLTVIPDVMTSRRTDKMYGRAAAVAAINAGIADVLVLTALDRASRNTRDGLTLLEEAKDEGWRVVTVRGEDSDAIGAFELTMKLAFAQEERERISERTKAGLRRAKRESRKLGRPSPIPRDVVKRIVDMRMRDGLSAKAIAAQLTKDGVPTPGGGAQWAHSTVRCAFAREGIQ